MSDALGYPLYMNGERLEEPVTISHVPSVSASPDGLGVITRPLPSLARRPATRAVSGELFDAAMHPMRGIAKALRGLGEDAAPASSALPAREFSSSGMSPAALAFGVALGLALRAGVGYVAGKAMAPSREQQGKYAGWGIVAAVLGGSLGIGIEAVVALNHRRG